MEKTIFIKHQFEGFHAYKDAPDEVAFLRHRHRHMFHVCVEVSVTHNERDLEYFIEQKFLKEIITTSELNNISCEQIAEDLLNTFNDRYEYHRYIKVTVSEDGENGSTVSCMPSIANDSITYEDLNIDIKDNSNTNIEFDMTPDLLSALSTIVYSELKDTCAKDEFVDTMQQHSDSITIDTLYTAVGKAVVGDTIRNVLEIAINKAYSEKTND